MGSSHTRFHSALRLTLQLLALSHFTSAFSFPEIQAPKSWSFSKRLGKRDDDTTTIPAPIVVAPSQYWDGIDGPWSSFALQVGTPAQNVRVMISTTATFSWTINSDGCPAGYVTDCENSRGFLFLRNESLTWVQNSIFQFFLEDNLGLDTQGPSGFDTVTLGWQGAGGPTVDHAIVFNIADSKYWIGEFGLNPYPTNFSTFVDPQPSYMTKLKENNTIPSLSYGYTAGNQYRLSGIYGSLVLGGYDQNRFEATDVTFPFYQDISRDLLVYLRGVNTDKALNNGGTDLLPSGTISTFIDSTVPMIYLPEDACKAFEDAFNLTYNTDFNVYTMTSDQRQALLDLNPSVTFTISPNATGGQTVDIALPYGAFDLEVHYPIIMNPNSSYYFPLQRAQNQSMYTLGRTFLQEAYLITDYERQNFTVAPCTWDANLVNTADIGTIRSINATMNGDGGSSGISGGAIAGVVVGIVAVIAILGLVLWLFRRRKQAEKKRVAELEAKEAEGAAKESHDTEGESKPFISAPIGGELGGGEIHELTAPHKPWAQEMESPHKVDPNKAGYSEMEGGEYFGPGKNYAHEMPGEQPIFEMAGSDVHEMPASERRQDEK